MKPATIVILGGEDDEHAAAMLSHLRRQGADVELLDSRWFPTQLALTLSPRPGDGELRLPSGRTLRLDEIQSVYWRNYHGVAPPPLAQADAAFLAFNDARSLLESLLLTLPARWVNGWEAYQMHQTKPVQLARVAALGVMVPATLWTNEGQALRAFAAQHANAIFKPVQGGDETRRLTTAHLTDANLANLALAPITVQAELPGTNIRVFVAGQRVLACEVRTAALDYRQDPQAELFVHDLPSSIEQQARQIAAALSLLWTGIDYRLTPDGQYVFLEANPSPMFLGFEAQTGLPLTDALARLLLGKSGEK